MNDNLAGELVGYVMSILDILKTALPLLLGVSFLICGCLIISTFLKG